MTGENHCRIIVIGFSGSGKSAVAPLVAAALGWQWCDTDEDISRLAGKSVPDIFAEDGEARFRELERQVLNSACGRNHVVVSTGGGAAVDPANRAAMHDGGMVVLLEARPETIHARLARGMAQGGAKRPLLEAPDPLQRIRELKEARQLPYATADWTVHTDDLTPEQVAAEVVRGWDYWSKARRPAPGVTGEGARVIAVPAASRAYSVFVGWGILDTLGRRMKQAGLEGGAFVVSDETVSCLYGQRVQAFLEDAGFRTASVSFPAGEQSKSLASVSRICDFLVQQKAERGDTVVALGGGVVGDVAGFAAATFLRGINVIQVPTTLVGMVDSAIGGKTGVDHPQGKNLIGAFHQPSLVLSDVQLLTTLPRRELSAGWAEVVKYGLIMDAQFYALLESRAGSLLSMDADTVVEAVSRSVAFKARIVGEDEKETKGRRTILNFGHTIGHGIEAATGYGAFLHGEAVAVGMVGAAMLSQRMGLAGPEVVSRVRGVLERLSLPVSCPGVSGSQVLNAIKLDKKVKGKAVRWVLLEGIGKAVVRSDVPAEYVSGVLAELEMNA